MLTGFNFCSYDIIPFAVIMDSSSGKRSIMFKKGKYIAGVSCKQNGGLHTSSLFEKTETYSMCILEGSETFHKLSENSLKSWYHEFESHVMFFHEGISPRQMADSRKWKLVQSKDKRFCIQKF